MNRDEEISILEHIKYKIEEISNVEGVDFYNKQRPALSPYLAVLLHKHPFKPPEVCIRYNQIVVFDRIVQMTGNGRRIYPLEDPGCFEKVIAFIDGIEKFGKL